MSFILKKREWTRTDNGKEILYGLNKNKADIGKLRDFFRDRIYKNDKILEADPGIYTWILKKRGDFYAAKTFTKQEIGTLHVNLKDLTNSLNASNGAGGNTVAAAGELEIFNDGTVQFNLLSGTYMVPIFNKKKSFEEKLALRNEIAGNIKDLLSKRYGIVANFIESDASEEERLGGKKILEGAVIQTKPENIEMLNSLFTRVEERTLGGRLRKKYTYRKRRFGKSSFSRRTNKNLK
jgi:hypothetical protein